ncbi:TetR family transcriptional regulator [Nonomuraea endophytica]|uniref:TetR family transcriptional regulator n=1 Tax=Nonomuraea endophytica TaxID=714136 RepID=UPI0037CAD3A7
MSEDEILDRLWRARFSPDGKHAECPACGELRGFHRLHGRRTYSCATCGHQISPTAGTVFHGSSTPLATWFAVIRRERARRGVGAAELARELGLPYATAWRLLKKAREERAGLDALGEVWNTGEEPPEPRPEKAAPSREQQLLAAARDVVVEEGLEATTVRAVAARAGVSTGVVHYYFENKDQILLKALRQAHEEASARRDAIMAEQAGSAEKLAGLIALAVPTHGAERDEFILWLEYFRVAMRGRLPGADLPMATRFRQYFFDVIEEGVRSGEFRPVRDVNAIAEQLIGLLDGLGQAAVLDRHWMSYERMAHLVQDFVESTLRPRRP